LFHGKQIVYLGYKVKEVKTKQNKDKMARKIEYRVVKEATSPPYYSLKYLCFDDKGEFIVGGEPLLLGRSLKELRDTLVKMIEAVDMAALEN
jgi:hypothetical protein